MRSFSSFELRGVMSLFDVALCIGGRAIHLGPPFLLPVTPKNWSNHLNSASTMTRLETASMRACLDIFAPKLKLPGAWDNQNQTRNFQSDDRIPALLDSLQAIARSTANSRVALDRARNRNFPSPLRPPIHSVRPGRLPTLPEQVRHF